MENLVNHVITMVTKYATRINVITRLFTTRVVISRKLLYFDASIDAAEIILFNFILHKVIKEKEEVTLGFQARDKL